MRDTARKSVQSRHRDNARLIEHENEAHRKRADSRGQKSRESGTLVAVGAGSVVAAAVSTAPRLAILSRHKALLFVFAAAILVTEYWVLHRSRSAAWRPGGVCHRTHPFGRTMRYVFWGSSALYLAALAAAYLSLPVAKAFGY